MTCCVPDSQYAAVSGIEINQQTPEWSPPSVNHVTIPHVEQTEILKTSEGYQTATDHMLVVKLPLEETKVATLS